MKKPDSLKLSTAQKIINAGLNHAAESLSFFMKEKLTFNEVIVNDSLSAPFLLSEKQGSDMHVLITEIIGDMKGVCYLILSGKEASRLVNTALSHERGNNGLITDEMGDAILLEIDNIISASVVTQFSNLLDIKIFGAVPLLKKLNSEQLTTMIQENIENGFHTLHFKIVFNTADEDFRPEFLWLLNDDFLERIESLSNCETTMEKFKTI